MPHTKWNIDEIELTRLQLNHLQQQLEQYSSTKKLGAAFFHGIVGGIKKKLSKKSVEVLSHTKPAANFFDINPDFKPYQIQLKVSSSGDILPKILHAIPYFITGGSQQLIVDLIEGLSDEYEHEVALLAIRPEQGYSGVTIHDCSAMRSPQSFTALLKSIKPDIVHVHYYGRYVQHYEGARWPYAFWQWYHIVFQGSFAYGCPVVENCNIPYVPYFHENISRYIYVSEYTRDTYGVRDMPNKVIYPGSNFSFFERKESQPDPDTIGMVYRLDHDKLNELSIEPFIKSVQKRPRTKVLIVGGGPYLELFQQRVLAAGLEKQFTFTGYVAYEKLAELYQQMAIFVAPVYSESFGQVTPFAMNMSIPVVAYNVGALEEMLINSEVLAPSGDAEIMSAIIVSLLDDPVRRKQIGAFNKVRATELFTVNTMTESYRRVYQSL